MTRAYPSWSSFSDCFGSFSCAAISAVGCASMHWVAPGLAREAALATEAAAGRVRSV